MSYLKCIRKHCATRNRQTNVEILGISCITNAYITEDGRLIAEFENLADLQEWNENIRYWKKRHYRNYRLYVSNYWDIDMQLSANYITLSGNEEYLYDEDDYAECYECGEVHKKRDSYYLSYEDAYVCESCYENYFFTCEECGDIHRSEDCIEVHSSIYTSQDHVKSLCRRCASEIAHECEDCGEWYIDDYMREAPDGTYYCDDHWSEHCTTCSCCGDTLWIDDAYRYDDEDYCECCYNDIDQDKRVRSYHDNPHRNKLYADGEENHGYLIGTEIETESSNEHSFNERKDITWEYGGSEDYIYQMEDGSLGEYGIECITQPMSKKFWDAFDFEGWMRDLVNAGARAHDTSTCGLHVHLSRTWLCTDDEDGQAILVGRMRQFLADNIDLVQKFARRTEQRWCAFTKSFDKDDKPTTKEERIAKHKEKGSKFNGDRYQSINNTNRATIEFRIFKGTLKPNTYRASVEFCLRVVDYILHTEENTETWEEFITYKQLPQSMIQYMTERHMQIKF